MVQTRSQDKSSGVKRPHADIGTSNGNSKSAKTSQPKKAHVEQPKDDNSTKRRPQSQTRKTDDKPAKATPNGNIGSSKVKAIADQVLEKCGDPPFKDLVDDKWPLSNVVMVHILNALLSSTRISHNIASKTLACLVEENYQDLKVLGETTWQKRTEVLTRGGYVHYREKTATYLGDLLEHMSGKHDNDASKILPQSMKGEKARNELTKALKEIKGLGQVGAEIFLDSIQGVFPNVAPCLDSRSRQTAVDLGLGDDVGAIFKTIGSDAATMARLAAGLTRVRLEKREAEFET